MVFFFFFGFCFVCLFVFFPRITKKNKVELHLTRNNDAKIMSTYETQGFSISILMLNYVAHL